MVKRWCVIWQAMRSEIHRMELRYAQLMKQQEKMVQEMEKSVAQRETIVLRTELENKKSSKKVYTHTHACTFNDPLSGTTRVSRYQKGKTNLDLTEARDSEWQWHQLGHVQVCTSLQTDR